MSQLADQRIEKEKQEKTGRLDLACCGLTELPDALFELVWLEELILGDGYWDKEKNDWIKTQDKIQFNYIHYISPEISKLKKLKLLRMSGQLQLKWEIVDISSLQHLAGLQTLDLSDNKIRDVSFIKRLIQLQTLLLSHNLIENLSFLQHLTGLQSLNLGSNEIQDLSFLRHLTGLQSLDLRSNKISNISSLQHLTALQKLVLSHNKISNISSLQHLTSLQALDLSYNRIQDISSLQHLTSLQTLKLSGNRIKDFSPLARHLIEKEKQEKTGRLDLARCGLTELPDALFELVWLEELVLSDGYDDKDKWIRSQNKGPSNQIRSISSEISKLKNLKSLRMNGQWDIEWEIEDISSLQHLTSLQRLDLSHNKIRELPSLQHLTSLQTLDLRHNQIRELPSLQQLTSLQRLNLSHNQIVELPSLQQLTSLQRLNLSHNQIVELPSLQQLTSLQRLNLSHNQIVELPSLQHLTSLQTLNLSHNQIVELPSLQHLTSLQRLNLSHNQIVEIASLQQLTALQDLDLSHNQIVDISSLPHLPALQDLDFSHNQIVEILSLQQLTALQDLDLSHNQIVEISSLPHLLALQDLDFSHNQIVEISSLQQLSDLRSLDLSHNQIVEISSLQQLSDLRSLDLSHNQIVEISSLQHLSRLRSLDLSSNQIREISPLLSFIRWHKMQVTLKEPRRKCDLNLSNNPIKNPPLEIVEQGNQAIIDYFQSVSQSGSRARQLIEKEKQEKTSWLDLGPPERINRVLMMPKIEYQKCEGPILSEYDTDAYYIWLNVVSPLVPSHYRSNKEIISLYPFMIELNKHEQITCFRVGSKTISDWTVRADLQVPEASYHRVSFVQNPIPSQQVKLWTTPDYSLLFVETDHCWAKPTQAIRLTDKAILEFCEDGIISGMWLLDLPEIIRRKKPSQGLYLFDMPTHTVKMLLQKEQRYQGLADTYRFFLNRNARRDWEREKRTKKEAYLAELYQRGFKDLVSEALTPYTEATWEALNHLTSSLTPEGILGSRFFRFHKHHLDAKSRRDATKFALDSEGAVYRLEITIELMRPEAGEQWSNKNRSYVDELVAAIELISQNKVKLFYK